MSTPLSDPETVEQYHAVIEKYPDQAYRFRAAEDVETLIVGDPETWPRPHQRRLIETIRRDEVFRRELISALGMEAYAKQASGQGIS